MGTSPNPEADKLRELITEARQTIKDLKLEKKNLENFIKEEMEQRITQEIQSGLDSFSKILLEQVDKASVRINQRFNTIEELLLGGKKKRSLEELISLNQTLREHIFNEDKIRDPFNHD